MNIKSGYQQLHEAGWRLINGSWANPEEVKIMSNQYEKIEEAIEYWRNHLHAHCEKGSPRDYLAINDLKLFMDEIFRLRDEVNNLEYLLKEASEGL